MIRFGTNPIAWSNDDDPNLGGHISLEQCLSEAGQIGFDGIENGNKFPKAANALTAALAPHGLAFVSAWYSLELLDRSVEAEKAALQPHLDLLKAMGSTVCIACETSNTVHGSPDIPLSQRPILPIADWPEFGAKIEEVAQFTADQGLPLVYHHHMGTVVQTPEEIDLLMHHTGPATKLAFDTGHCFLGGQGADPMAVLKRHIGRLGHFHAKNVRPDVMKQIEAEDLSFLNAVRRGIFTVPGDDDGALDFTPFMQFLADAGYDGWLVIEAEQDPDIYEPLKYQTTGLNTLKGLAQEAGLIT